MRNTLMARSALALALLTAAALPATAALPIPGASARWVPSVTSYANQLYVFYLKYGSTRIAYKTTTDGSTWSIEQLLPTTIATPDEGPSAVAFNDKLYLFYSTGHKELRYHTMDSTGTWSGELGVPGSSTDDGPGLAVFSDHLYVFWETAGSNDSIRYSILSKSGNWMGPFVVPFGKTRARPAATVFNNRLYIAYSGIYGTDSQQIWYGYLSATGSWVGEWKPTGSPRTRNGVGPGLAAWDNKLWLTYSGGNTINLYQKNLDSWGNWSPEAVMFNWCRYLGPDSHTFNNKMWTVFIQEYPQVYYVTIP